MTLVSEVGQGAAPSAEELLFRFRRVRAQTERLAAPLSPEDCQAQSMPDCSPTKWHLAHTSWFFETFVLQASGGSGAPFHPRYEYLFNSYYNSVGDRHARPRRGLLTRPGLEEIRRYRAHVDERVGELLCGAERRDGLAALLPIVELGLHHEQQHQELLLTDIKHLLGQSPLQPAYQAAAPEPAAAAPRPLGPPRFVPFAEGLRDLGHGGAGFAFDNEGPRHRVFLRAFAIAHRPVCWGEYLAFIEAGGYRRPEFWLSDGWDLVQREGLAAPLYLDEGPGGARSLFTLAGPRPLREDEPVSHLSYYEADAYARFAGARLPTEAEWEVAAASAPIQGNLLESARLHPAPAPSGSADGPGLAQLVGDVWEWTASPYAPYPGYQPPPGALGEYNGKFMCNQIVLRGGSCLTPRSHIRPTYRNFFPPGARWQMTGIRLAKDL